MHTTQPATKEIHETIDIIQAKIDAGKLPPEVREGYEEALNILTYEKSSYKDISPVLRSMRARAIAVLAVDYLNGECEQRVLVGIEK